MGFFSSFLSLGVKVWRGAAIVGLALTSGCAYLPFPNGASTGFFEEERPPNPADQVSVFLSSGTGALARRFESSPWGDDVLVEAEPVYHAATGASCRRMAVSGAGIDRKMLACATAGGVWVTQRLVVSAHSGN